MRLGWSSVRAAGQSTNKKWHLVGYFLFFKISCVLSEPTVRISCNTGRLMDKTSSVTHGERANETL